MMVDQCFLEYDGGRYEDTRGPLRSFTISTIATTYLLTVHICFDGFTITSHFVIGNPCFSPSLVLRLETG